MNLKLIKRWINVRIIKLKYQHKANNNSQIHFNINSLL